MSLVLSLVLSLVPSLVPSLARSQVQSLAQSLVPVSIRDHPRAEEPEPRDSTIRATRGPAVRREQGCDCGAMTHPGDNTSRLGASSGNEQRI
jgi:hypothetical protein